jgi:hypothetical protein
MTAIISLVVKGPRAAAEEAAKAREIPFTFVREVRGNSVGTAPEEYRKAVADWFVASCSTAPFPPGDLLLYGDRES